MSIINFEGLPLEPNESRAARNFLGLSQAQAADQSKLPAHKIKRFETGNYVPDSQFLTDLREFFEAQGYNFQDQDSPGAKAKARGDIFPAGVVDDTSGSTGKTSGSPSGKPGKLPRPQTANLQFMRITPALESDQIDRVFDCIEANETAINDAADQPISCGFLSDSPDSSAQAKAVAMLRCLAENGLLYARLMGRDLLPTQPEDTADTEAPSGFVLFSPASKGAGTSKTIGGLLQAAMQDVQLAVIDGDKAAQARRKGRVEPTEVLQALVG